MTEELKPCPFCGRRVEHVSRACNQSATGMTYIVSCFCGGYSACAHQQEDTLEEVVKAWNTRALTAAQPAQATPGLRTRLTADPTDPAVQARLAEKFGDVQATPVPVGDVAATSKTVKLATTGYLEAYRPDGTKLYTRPAPGVPGVPGVRNDDLPGHLAEISIAVCDGDSPAAQSGLRDAIRLLAAAQQGAEHA